MKSSPASPATGSSLSLRQERTAKTKMRKVRLCESRLFLQSSLGSRQTLIVNSLAILSVTQEESKKALFFSSFLFAILSLSYTIPIFRPSHAKKNILCIYDTMYTVLSP